MMTLTAAGILFAHQGEVQVSALFVIGASIWGLAATINDRKGD